MTRPAFEWCYLIAAPVTLWLLLQFSFYAMLDRFLPRWLVVVLALPFIVQDVIYNLLIGSLLFWEWPREWLFTDRLKRHDRLGSYGVDRFAVTLNALDPGHV